MYVCKNRFNKSVQKLKSTIDSGKFGKILYAVASIRWIGTMNITGKIAGEEHGNKMAVHL